MIDLIIFTMLPVFIVAGIFSHIDFDLVKGRKTELLRHIEIVIVNFVVNFVKCIFFSFI